MKKLVLILYLFSGISVDSCINEDTANCTSFRITVSTDSENLKGVCCEEFCSCKCCKTIQLINVRISKSNSYFHKTSLFTTSSDTLVEAYSSHWQPPNTFYS